MTTSKNNPTENTADREIVITRVFDAPRELVWQAFTDPEHVVKWWGPRGFTTTIEEMNVKPGGVWRHVMHGPDGTDYPNKSVFTEVEYPERIVYVHGGARKGGPSAHFVATWTFDALDDGKTRLTMRSVFPSAEDRDKIVKEYGAIEGGRQTLERLGEQLAKTPVVIERTFDAPVEIVWKAMTDVEQMKQWSFGIDEFRPELGFEFRFDAGKDGVKYVHRCKIMEVISGKKLAYGWRYEGYEGDSLVTIELFAEGDKTRIKLTHDGLETFLPERHPDFARGNFAKGWTQIIGLSLKAFVEKAAPSEDILR
jgi:uncharacterized protein YndB with AHSA1/START domain